uniref:CCHC-type domain-containing protein n=1 Tax=Fagus sylvatica TaxID=28930 RepID=A0A2N9GVD6_FAGSY
MEGEKMAYKMMNQDFVKLDKFDGSNFIRWQDKMKFLLTALKIFYVLDPNLQPIPDPTPQDTEQLKQQRIKKEEDELVCKGHILNTLFDQLYDLFTTMTSPKEIWKALETKYKTEKQGTDKFIIQKYFDFKMMDNVSVLDQVHELQILVHKLNDLSIKIPELFQVGAIIAKLPPSWNNYRKKLLHMAEELTLEQIGTHLRIEKESRIREGTNYVSKVNEGTVNYVLNGGVGSSKTNKSFRPNKKIVKKTNSNKDKKGRACFHCGKKGHYIRECRFLKNQMKEKELNTSEANVVDEIVAMVSEMQIGMITEVHMANAAENSSEWWYDSGATIHVCNNKMLFKEYVEAGNGLEVLMGNHNTAKVLGTGTVELILSSGKKLKLTNVYHVPDIKKNLVSASLLSKNGVKAVLESDKLILSKFGVFVGKGYSCNGMYKLNLIINKNDVGYAYIVNSSLLWHARLGHLNFKYMKYMSKHGLISYKQDVHDKCEICIESKIRKKPFPSTNRDSQLLELVHSDVCELNGILTRGGKRYFITFIDDFSRVLCKKIQSSPYELWNGRKPNLSYLKVWGCIAYFRVPNPKRTKLGPRAIKSVFVGYAVNSKAYRLLDLSSNTIVESRDVEFIENKFINDSQIEPKQTQESDSLVNDSLSGNKRIEPSSPNEQRRSQRVRKEKDFGPDFISYQVNVYLVEGNREKVLSKLPFVGNVEEDPNTYSEAMASRDAAFWREAVNDEMDSILSNNTWVLVDLPPSSNTIGCKWVFRRKYRTDGTIQTFKARLVAKGFRQREGIDYFDTYAPVARITSIRVLFDIALDIGGKTWPWLFKKSKNVFKWSARLSATYANTGLSVGLRPSHIPKSLVWVRVVTLASIYKLVVHQMDVKTAFLNGDLDEEVYMDQPEGFVLPGNEKKVYKLVKSLYGLKQAPKQWHEKFDTVILANGFKHNGADKCVYSKFTSEYGVIVCLYVDDMLIFGTNMLGVCETKKYLASVFKMKDLNEADTILGIKVKRHSEGYALCQNHYIEKVLLKYKHLNVKEVNTPFDSNYKLVENTGRAIAQLEFASAIGSMMYAMHCTRPDIAFAVNRLSRYTSNPSAEHWKAIARVLGYLKKTKDLGLYYSGYPAVLEGYSDANWVTSVGDNKSTSGWIFTLGGGAISWASKKQSCISHSTMESEFIALASAGKEAEWLRNMLYDIELWPQPMSAISIYCDSQATMSKAYSKIYNGKSRHISLRHEYVRQLVEDGVISIVYVKSSGNLADPFTKGLSRDMTGFEDLGSLEFLPNPVYWTTNPVDWMTCIWLTCWIGGYWMSSWESASVAWTTNSGDWIMAVRGS